MVAFFDRNLANAASIQTALREKDARVLLIVKQSGSLRIQTTGEFNEITNYVRR